MFPGLEASYHPMVDRSTLACDLCHLLLYCFNVLIFGINSIEVMVHGAMVHVVVKLSVCRNDVELLAGVCLFVL